MVVVRDLDQNPGVHQVGQPLIEHVAGDPEALLELVESGHPEEGVAQDQHRPPLADDLEALGYRAVHVRETLAFHTTEDTGLLDRTLATIGKNSGAPTNQVERDAVIDPQTPAEGALHGLRVVEAGLLVQGPQAAATLSDWGAEVVKVELPGFGDQSRWLLLAPDDPRSAYFIACNRGKRSVTIDLRNSSGREVFLRLVETADVVITNFKPGTMEAWGLGYEEVAARNPRVVYAAGSTFGEIGPDAQREGADLSGQAAGGLISTTGMDGGDPTPIGVTIADHIAAQNLVGSRGSRPDRNRTAGCHLPSGRPDLGAGE